MVDAGFILQIDDPGVMTSWDMIKPEPSIGEYRRHLHAASMRSITRSPAFRKIACATTSAGVPGMARTPMTCRSRRSSISCSRCARKPAVSKPAMSVTSTSGRWQDVKLPAGRIIVPGVVSHATNLIEHPEVIAQRICNFARSGRARERGRRHRLRAGHAASRGFGLGEAWRARRRRSGLRRSGCGAEVNRRHQGLGSAPSPRWRRGFI